MDPYVFDWTHTKDTMLDAACAVADIFTSLNRLPVVRVQDRVSCHYGFYRYGRDFVVVNMKRCRMPARVPGYSWSYPGYKADLTPYGVIAHELGHHVWYHIMREDRIKQASWKYTSKSGAPVSSYEPNPEEAFAESIKLWITNPALLRDGRPERFNYLQSLGLVTVHGLSWRSALCNAHPRLITAAEQWIAR